MKLSSSSAFILLTTALYAASTSSARPTRRSGSRRNAVSLQDTEAGPSASFVKRQNAAAVPATGFCRKRSPQTQVQTSTSLDTAGQSSSVQTLSIPIHSCQPSSGSSECLPTITIDPQVATSYVEITTTVFVTAGEATPTSLAASSATALSSQASVPSQTASTPAATSTVPSASAYSSVISIPTTSSTAPSAPPSITASVSTAAPPPPASSVSASPPPANNVCPPGSSWRKVSDNFSSFDTSKWKKEAGMDEQMTFGQDGLFMKLNEKNPTIVFESQKKWIAPVTLTASIKSARAPGIVNCAIFGQLGTDEIDLELIEGTYQLPMWRHDPTADGNSTKLVKNKDYTLTITDTSREMAEWKFDDKNVIPFNKVHDWTARWDKDHLSWSADGKQLVDFKRIEGGNWLTQALPFRWGPWATDKGWAGPLDWAANPEPVMQFKSVVIEGCQLD